MDRFDENYISTEQASTGLHISREHLETTGKWAGIFGIFTIISGVLSCIGAIGTFGLGLIPGGISIFLGLKLNKVKKSIEQYLSGETYAINDTFENLGSYFKIQTVLMIIGIILLIIAMIFFLIFGLAAFNEMNGTNFQ